MLFCVLLPFYPTWVLSNSTFVSNWQNDCCLWNLNDVAEEGANMLKLMLMLGFFATKTIMNSLLLMWQYALYPNKANSHINSNEFWWRHFVLTSFCLSDKVETQKAGAVRTRVTKTPSARQQCWPESFCKSGKFLRQVHYWLKNFRILCNTKYPDNMQSVRMNRKVFG